MALPTGGVSVEATYEKELALRESTERTLKLLKDSEERFRLVAQSAEDAIVTVDARGTIAFWNPAAERVFGYAAPDTLGQPLTLLVPERLRAARQAAFERALTQGKLELGPRARVMDKMRVTSVAELVQTAVKAGVLKS